MRLNYLVSNVVKLSVITLWYDIITVYDYNTHVIQ